MEVEDELEQIQEEKKDLAREIFIEASKLKPVSEICEDLDASESAILTEMNCIQCAGLGNFVTNNGELYLLLMEEGKNFVKDPAYQ